MASNDALDIIRLDEKYINAGQSIYSMYSPSNIPTSGSLGFRFISHPKSHAELIQKRSSTFHSFLFAARLKALIIASTTHSNFVQTQPMDSNLELPSLPHQKTTKGIDTQVSKLQLEHN